MTAHIVVRVDHPLAIFDYEECEARLGDLDKVTRFLESELV
jgi:hypothetical protein